MASNKTTTAPLTDCFQRASVVATFAIIIINFVAILIGCKVFHVVLRRLGQPRLVSDFLVGVVSGVVVDKVLDGSTGMEQDVLRAIAKVEEPAFSAYMFVLGLEMDPIAILGSLDSDTMIAYGGIASALLVTALSYPALSHPALSFPSPGNGPLAAVTLAVALASTASPIVTRLTTELKIGKSRIGRVAVRAAILSELLPGLLMCCGVAINGFAKREDSRLGGATVFLVFLAAEVLVVFKVVTPLLGWLNRRNPEGKPMRGFDMVGTMAGAMLLCYAGYIVKYNTVANAFLVGLMLPREGRTSTFLISNFNYILSAFILPLYTCLIGIQVIDIMGLVTSDQHTWYKFATLAATGTVGKISGILLAAMHCGHEFPEAMTLGALLNIKGYPHVYAAVSVMRAKLINFNTWLVLILEIIASIVCVPAVVAVTVRRARRKNSRAQLMGLQWYRPGNEMRLIAGLRAPENVPSMVNLIEAMRGGVASVEMYAVDMVELTGRAAATLVHGHGEGGESVTVADESVMEMREQVGAALEAYIGESGEGMRLRRVLAVSSFLDMHEDICGAAQDAIATLILLPFHKSQRVDGAMDDGNPGFRLVNEKVLQLAPCSVGILVDRGLGRSGSISIAGAAHDVAVVFIGGADDREALAYASILSHHPAIRLMVIRFLPDAAAQAWAASSIGRIITDAAVQEMELRADDEYFTGFYDGHVATRRVGYTEKHVANGAEAVATLRALEGQYQLFIVGQGRERDSLLTVGMSEWAECPELGPIGDILAASDFSLTASVLVIQQHDLKRDPRFSELLLP